MLYKQTKNATVASPTKEQKKRNKEIKQTLYNSVGAPLQPKWFGVMSGCIQAPRCGCPLLLRDGLNTEIKFLCTLWPVKYLYLYSRVHTVSPQPNPHL